MPLLSSGSPQPDQSSGRSLRFVEKRKSKILPFALIGWCFSDGDFQSLAPYGVDENENENSDDSVLMSVASIRLQLLFELLLPSLPQWPSAASNAKRRLRAAAT